MNTTFPLPGLLAIACILLSGSQALAEPTASDVDFARDIRPILAEHCFACHGPDADSREADLRLDVPEQIYNHSRAPAIVVPHRPEKSELLLRVTASDAQVRMPPPQSGKELSANKISLIRHWIDQGARWEPHWAYVAPRRPPIPRLTSRTNRNPIDAFIAARLADAGLEPQAEADRETLIRRVTLDLTGLPPTLAEIDAFLEDRSDDAYEKIVDRLLASLRYGERMAVPWLNAARYADTYGYQDDGEVSMWRWRDWVIGAFNENMPFDQFTIEQLAGDLLPNPTLEQRLATGFNRNHRANSEGGAIAAEFRTEAVADRVHTTSTVWLGLTADCAKCHDHKFDPITQREYYQLFAFFNNVPEDGRARKKGNTPPMMAAPTREQLEQERVLEDELARCRQALANMEPAIARAQADWERAIARAPIPDFTVSRDLEVSFAFDSDIEPDSKTSKANVPTGNVEFDEGILGQCVVFDGASYIHAGDLADFSDDDKFTLAAWVWPEEECNGSIISRTEDDARPEGYDLLVQNGRLRVHLNVEWADDAIRLEVTDPLPIRCWSHVAVTVDGSCLAKGVRVYVNGKPQKVAIEIDSLFQSFGNNGPLRIGASGNPASHFRGRIDEVRIFHDVLNQHEIELLATSTTITDIVALAPSERTAAQSRKLRECFLSQHTSTEITAAHDRLVAAENALKAHRDTYPSAMVMEELPQSPTARILHRGLYDRPGDVVTADVPAILPPLPDDVPRNRLGLARWLVHPQNPLTARVIVNRLWQLSFGEGLVRTPENFGVQGEPPTHPQLLDWLACELIESGWDIKAMRRLIVTSHAYRQSSHITLASSTVDPANRLHSRGPRFRLPAEMLRDQALFVGDLLFEKIGGPSVRPYQPAGLWEELSNDRYVQDHGSKLYRRGLYTFWKRTIPFPSLALFDAPNREVCQVHTHRTNTPLQALVLLNEISFVEAARGLAIRTMQEGGVHTTDRLAYAFRRVTCRRPTSIERRTLKNAFDRHLDYFQNSPEAADHLLNVGELENDDAINGAELATYTVIANMLLNLDEVVTQH